MKGCDYLLFLSMLLNISSAAGRDIVYPDINWLECTPEEQKVDSKKLDFAMKRINTDHHEREGESGFLFPTQYCQGHRYSR
jgi:hypothetical protein